MYYNVFHRPESIHSQFNLRQWLFLFHTFIAAGLAEVRACNRNSNHFISLGEDKTSVVFFSLFTFVFFFHSLCFIDNWSDKLHGFLNFIMHFILADAAQL